MVDFYSTYIEPAKQAVTAANPGNLGDWMNIGFDLAKSGWTSATRLTMKIESDAENYRLYDVTGYAHREQNSVVIALDAFSREGGTIDMSDISQISFELAGPGSYSVANLSLITPKTASETGPEPGETLGLGDGGVRQALPRGDTFFASLIHNALIDPDGYGSLDFTGWTNIEFDVYVGDYEAFKNSGNQIRVTLGSPTYEQVLAGEDPGYFYPDWQGLWHEPFNNLPHYHNHGTAVYNFSGRLHRSGWTHVSVPLSSPIATRDGFDMAAVRTLWFYLEGDGKPLPQGTFEVRNIYLSGKVTPPEPEDELVLLTGTAERNLLPNREQWFLIAWPQVNVIWPNGGEGHDGDNDMRGILNDSKPVSFAGWEKLEFELYLENKDGLANPANDIRIQMVSGGDIDRNVRVYSFSDAVRDSAFGTGIGNWQTVTVPLGSFIADNLSGAFNIESVRGMRFTIYTGDATSPGDANFAAKVGVKNIRLTGRQEAEPPPEKDEDDITKPPPPPESEGALHLIRGLFNRWENGSDWRHWPNMADHPNWTHWPTGEPKPTDFGGYANIELDVYVEDMAILNGREFRLSVVSGGVLNVSNGDIDRNANIYELNSAIIDGGFAAKKWQTVTIPIASVKYPNIGGVCDMADITGMRVYFEGVAFDVGANVAIANIRLT